MGWSRAPASRVRHQGGARPDHQSGSKLVRWAAIEAVSGRRGTTKLRADFDNIAARRGKYKARAAVARKLLTLVYYGLRDGEIRCLTVEAA